MNTSLLALIAFVGYAIGGDAERPFTAAIGGDAERPFTAAIGGDAERPFSPATPQIIRAIDSVELKGLNILEAHNADEWFV